MANRPVEQSLAYVITQAQRQIRDRIEERFRAFGVDLEHWWVLKALEEGKGRSMGDLAEAVLMNHPTLTKLIDRMVSAALVYRVPDPTDRRRVLIFRSERGSRLCDELAALEEDFDAALSARLGESRANQLVKLLIGVARATESAGS